MPPVFIIGRSTSNREKPSAKMRNYVLLPASLALLICSKDTGPPNEWRRAIEPRLSTQTVWQPWHPILRRGRTAPCDEPILTADAARHAVALTTACLDD